MDNTDYVDMAMECMDKANDLVREYRPMLDDVFRHIFLVPYSQYRQFLYARYFKSLKYPKIAKDMELSTDGVYDLARRAIKAFEETFTEEEKKAVEASQGLRPPV